MGADAEAAGAEAEAAEAAVGAVGICAIGGADAAPGALAAPARSNTLVPSGRCDDKPAVPKYASPSVHAKNAAAQNEVERDRKLALPEAPNRLPEAPLPNDAPMSAPLPCCTSTKPIIAMAEMI